MTYALAWPLQKAIYERLLTDPAVAAIAGGRVFDAAPAWSGPAEAEGPYAVLGEESVRDWSSVEAGGAAHVLTVSVFGTERGFAQAKRLAGTISEALTAGDLVPERGRVASVAFLDARARREARGRLRRIDLRFRARVEDDA
ncbi:MAG: DUF3168 domain-containing protein [Paracoccaceae bacterium]